MDVGISHAFKCQYRKQLIRKAVAMIDRELLGDASKMKIASKLFTLLQKPGDR